MRDLLSKRITGALDAALDSKPSRPSTIPNIAADLGEILDRLKGPGASEAATGKSTAFKKISALVAAVDNATKGMSEAKPAPAVSTQPATSAPPQTVTAPKANAWAEYSRLLKEDARAAGHFYYANADAISDAQATEVARARAEFRAQNEANNKR